MIAVRLNREDFVYDIYSLVKAFFPSEDVTVKVGDALGEAGEDISLLIATDYLEHSIEILFYHGKDAVMPSGGGRPECPEPFLCRRVDVDFSDRKDTKNRLKQAYYRMLQEYTGQSLPWGSLTGIRPVKIPMTFLEEGKDEDFIRDYMRRTYFASEEKIDLSIEVARRELEVLGRVFGESGNGSGGGRANGRNIRDDGHRPGSESCASNEKLRNGFGLYIGIPFCPSTCLYCSFTSYPLGIWKDRVEEYLDALGRELALTAERMRDRRPSTIYIGGGTPTTLEPHQLRRLIDQIKSNFDLSCCLEFTVEAGRPDSITREKLQALKDEGVTRISVNPQTMNQETLKIIGRHHTAEQVAESFLLAREMGFDNINMDLIMGLPNEDIQAVERTMRRVGELAPDSLTVHSLALKRASRLNISKENYQDLTFENTWETIRLAARHAREMGLLPYYLYRQKNMAGNFENVGYAKPGKEGIYNILMMEERQDIAAFGAGAVSKRVCPGGRTKRCENVKDVAIYIEKIDEMIERKRRLFEG